MKKMKKVMINLLKIIKKLNNNKQESLEKVKTII